LEAVARLPRQRSDVAVGGKSVKKLGKESRRLRREIVANGGEIVKGRKHTLVKVGGEVVQTIDATYSDHRSIKNQRASLKRRGLAA
jgi:hypothetical protein